MNRDESAVSGEVSRQDLSSPRSRLYPWVQLFSGRSIPFDPDRATIAGFLLIVAPASNADVTEGACHF
jgi:hypothetical protein